MTYADLHPDSTGTVILSCLGAAAVIAAGALIVVPLVHLAAGIVAHLIAG